MFSKCVGKCRTCLHGYQYNADCIAGRGDDHYQPITAEAAVEYHDKFVRIMGELLFEAIIKDSGTTEMKSVIKVAEHLAGNTLAYYKEQLRVKQLKDDFNSSLMLVGTHLTDCCGDCVLSNDCSRKAAMHTLPETVSVSPCTDCTHDWD